MIDLARLRALRAVATYGTVTAAARALHCTPSAVSQHLNVLKRLRLIKSRRDGKVIYHSLDDAHINTLLAICLEHIGDRTED